MKQFKNYLSALVVFAMVFTSCSKEESSALDDADANFVELTFGAVLNDLANRAANKSQHFDAIPTCAETAPDYARINFSYGGENHEAVVDILMDSDGYYTAYSEDLKIPVNGGSTMVTLTGFLVYDSSHTIIWAAPVGSGFANYVDQVLPQSFNIAAGTKPFIDVDVLCFDRRMVNEYGYVFFDIVPEVIYPFCAFINYCSEEGRHWVANYSIDLYYGTNANGIQLYDSEDAEAQVSVGTRNGQFYADPLCLVVPGPPANLPDNQPYLYMVIYPNDWDANYGDIDNTPIPVQLSWNNVNALLNNDGTSNEYLHLLIGECEGALQGDGTITPPPPCDLTEPEEDCNNDGTLNKCDPSNPNWDDFDCDGDGFINSLDACPNTPGITGGVGGDGCPAGNGGDPCANLDPVCSIPQTQETLDDFCYMLYADYSNPEGFVLINSYETVIELENLIQDVFATAEIVGTLTDDGVSLAISLDGTQVTDRVIAYEIEVRPNSGSGSPSESCWESQCNSSVTINLEPSENQEPIVVVFNDYNFTGFPVFVRITAVVCELPVTGP